MLPRTLLATAPFGPIVQAAHLLRRELPDAFADAAANYPALARLFSDQGAVEIDRATLLRTLAAALCAMARQRAFALVLEDMQWVDCATLELVAELAREARRAPLFVVLVHRSDGVPRGHPVRMLRDALRRARILNEICVEPLERPEALLLAERLLDGESSEEARLAIVDRSGGVPLFIEAMAAALRARGGVAATPLCAATLPLPETVRDAIMDGVDALPTAGRHAADAAAVAGSEFSLAFLVALNGSDEGIEALLGCGLLREREPGAAVFRTPLTRDAIYAAIPWTRRRNLHRRAAEALVAVGASIEQAAGHWQAAGDDERARDAWLRGGRTLAALARAWRRRPALAPRSRPLARRAPERRTARRPGAARRLGAARAALLRSVARMARGGRLRRRPDRRPRDAQDRHLA